VLISPVTYVTTGRLLGVVCLKCEICYEIWEVAYKVAEVVEGRVGRVLLMGQLHFACRVVSRGWLRNEIVCKRLT
jgi:hypothetical protein